MIATYAPTKPNRVAHADRSGFGVRTGLTINMANLLSASIFHTEAFTKADIIASYRHTHSVEQIQQHYAERDAWDRLVLGGYIVPSTHTPRRWEVNFEKARTVLPLACQYRDIRIGN